jgi:ankyrin repeat protein
MVCSRNTSLEELARKLQYVAQKASGSTSASNGLLHLHVTLPEPDTEPPTFTIKLEALPHPPDVTVDITGELQMLDLTSELVGIYKAKGKSVVAEKEGLDRKLKDRSKRLERVKRAREMVEVELRKLEERKKELAEEEKNEAEEMRLLRERKAAVEEQQEQASARWSNALKRWDELCHTDCDKAGYGSNGVAHWTPLRWAAENGYAEMVELLLSEGADVTVADKDGWTPLIAASSKGHLDVVRLFLDNGAEVNLKDKTARAAISYAAGGGHRTIVQLLLKEGADVTVADKDGWTPLIAASSKGHLDVVRLLLDNGAEVNLKDKTARAAISYAAEGGHRTIVQLLLKKGVIGMWRLQRTLKGHSEAVCSVAISPDSTVLAYASEDCTIRLWDIETEQVRWTFEGHSEVVCSVDSHPTRQSSHPHQRTALSGSRI